jgi:phosphate transport system permease protein
MNKTLKKRKLQNLAALVISSLCAAVGLFFLFFILFDVLRNGIAAINWDLFLRDPVPPFSEEAGGLRNAFVGQAMLTLAAMAIGIPLGMLGGTYLAEYGRFSKLGRIVSVLSDIAVSMPSIVIGTFIYAIMVRPMGTFSGWAGAVALAIIMLPVVIRTTEDMMRLVPWTLREAAFALGAPYYKVIIQIVYKSASRGIMTGVLLAVARIAGETAPLLFTSFNNNFFSLDMTRPMPSLTVTIYQYAASPYDSWVQMAWAAAFVITFIILLLNILGRVVIGRRNS